jgi:hypothetical protein
MKRIILILSVFLFSCEKPPEDNAFNTTVIFWASSSSQTIEKDGKEYEVRQLETYPPDCDQRTKAPNYYVFKDEPPAKYTIRIKRSEAYWEVFTYTLKENECKRLDVSNAYGWD